MYSYLGIIIDIFFYLLCASSEWQTIVSVCESKMCVCVWEWRFPPQQVRVSYYCHQTSTTQQYRSSVVWLFRAPTIRNYCQRCSYNKQDRRLNVLSEARRHSRSSSRSLQHKRRIFIQDEAIMPVDYSPTGNVRRLYIWSTCENF